MRFKSKKFFKVFDSELHIGFEEAVLEAVMVATVRPGEVIHITSQGIKVIAPDGVILIKVVQVEGSKMAAADFAEQVGLKVGDRLGTRQQHKFTETPTRFSIT